MIARSENAPGQPFAFSAREISLAREIRREAITMIGPSAQLEELPKEVQAGIEANKKVSALISLCHVLGTIGGIETDFLREHIAERLSKELENDLQNGAPVEQAHFRPIAEIKEAERALRAICEDPIHRQREESMDNGSPLEKSMDDRAHNLLYKVNGEAKIDTYDFVLGENNWIWELTEDSKKNTKE